MLILTPAYTSVTTGTSMRKENKRSDAVDKSLFDLLYKSFHGDSENSDQASFVKLFCTMAGPFQAFVDKGYVTVSTTQATDNQDSEEVIRLDFSGILRFESQFILPSNLSMKIRKSTLKPNCVDLMNQCSLQSVCLMMTEKM